MSRARKETLLIAALIFFTVAQIGLLVKEVHSAALQAFSG